MASINDRFFDIALLVSSHISVVFQAKENLVEVFSFLDT